MKTLSVISILVTVCILVGGCSQEQKESARTDTKATSPPLSPLDTILPPTISAYDLVLTADPVSVTPDNAEDYLGQNAADYATYRFVAMKAASYRVEGEPVSVELTQFSTANDAYGFYARMRPFGIQSRGIGTECFQLGNGLYFTAGEYVVTLSVDELTLPSDKVRTLLAQEINSRITQARPPGWFMLFPSAYRVGASNQYFPSGFFGDVDIKDIYTTSFALEGDTNLFFLALDESGDQFLSLQQWAQTEATIVPMPEGFSFPEHSIAFEQPQHGLVVAGLVRQKLVGIRGYHSKPFKKLATEWIIGLQL